MEWLSVIWDNTLLFLGWSAFSLALLVGVVLNFIGLFGSWVIIGAVAIVYLISGFGYFEIATLIGLVVLAVSGEVAETAAAGYGASRFGGGKGSIVAAIVGCIAGAIFGTPLIPIPLIGTVIGACLGAFIGATLYEMLVLEKHIGHAAHTGFGAALGKVGGILAKFAVALVMVILVALDLIIY